MRFRKAMLCGCLAILALLVWVPFWMLLSGSLMSKGELLQNLAPVLSPEGASGYAAFPFFPREPSLSPYVGLLLDTPEFFQMFWNSCFQVAPAVLGQVLIGAPAAWAFARFQFRGKGVLWTLYIVLMLMPFQITMVSNYLILDTLGLLDSHWAIILPAAFSTFPVFLMTRFFAAIPEATLEAAALDGCSPLRTFVQIGMPLGAPGVLSAAVLGFLEGWSALEQPLAFLKTKVNWPLSLYLPNITADNAGISLAASILMLAPALLVFLAGQKYLEQGVNTAGLKE